MARQRSKPLATCPRCNRATLRRENAGRVDGQRVCDDCVIDHAYEKIGNNNK